MADFFKILRYEESERLDENGSNWNFWKTRITVYLKGMRQWSYITGTAMKPTKEPEKLEGWEENDAQALSTILMNITPNAQARLDCTSSKSVWDGLVAQYAQADPIAQNLAHTRLLSK